MGVSNALGANTMNILFSLGMPWFIKSLIKGINSNSYIRIDSESIKWTILSLVVIALCLFLTLFFNKFNLSRLSGGILFTIYVAFIITALVSELVFFKSDKVPCS